MTNRYHLGVVESENGNYVRYEDHVKAIEDMKTEIYRMVSNIQTELNNRAIRQYRHNDDNSPDILNPEQGFVIAYDEKETKKVMGEFLILTK